MSISRRRALEYALYSAGGLALRSLISGIPMQMLANPARALARQPRRLAGAATPQFLIYSTSAQGDPINCNVPGTYNNAAIYHAADPCMAATTFTMGSQSVVGAQIWSTLSASTLAQTCFFHHATYTSVHPDETDVLGLMGATASKDMLVSVIGKQMQAPLSTIQAAPISVSASSAAESIYFQGAPQHIYSPSQLSAVLGPVNLGPAALQAIRDKTVDDLNAFARSHSTPYQADFLDNYVRSQQQARLVPDTLLAGLAQLQDASVASQIKAALILFQMRITPVVVIHVPFGGDNHVDSALAAEVTQHQSAVASIASMATMIQAAGMANEVTFATQNVFGRTLSTRPINGRSHNASHHVSLLCGPNIVGGQVGGVSTLAGGGFGAQPINSITGAATANGDIAFADTFASMGKTLCAAVGIPNATINTLIESGTSVQSALVYN